MLEHNEKYGVVLAFDVNITREAQELADSFKPPIKVFKWKKCRIVQLAKIKISEISKSKFNF